MLKTFAGVHEIPFGITKTRSFRLFSVTTGFGKDIYVSTRKTIEIILLYSALNMTFPRITFAVEHVVDRWWSFTGEGIKAHHPNLLREENTLASTMATDLENHSMDRIRMEYY